MANSPAQALWLREGDRAELMLGAVTTIRAELVQHANIMLLASEGVADARIAGRCRDDDVGAEVAKLVCGGEVGRAR